MTNSMKVVKTLEVEVPRLGQRIKEAREADPRSLKEICKTVGMSQMNWYRIEDEKQMLPENKLRKIEQVLGVDFGVSFDD
ncbi:helix-turn-helix domain protein [Crinalium epipsammum PCC 9333]|uniref:Helix-turn-helix domain protein n=1 Tax=Crinalium epipsammum PCC 9333 TaxID=1173022 RepID=K9VV15_9CYAN|nr:helix-turn-helix transcriptional regulator [Crinalium epipsammum]AFZ11327.1 helix-turn-helix domain protein [Crinalium epipsammum PCC 9333]